MYRQRARMSSTCVPDFAGVETQIVESVHVGTYASVQVCRFASCANWPVRKRAGVRACLCGRGQVGRALKLHSMCNKFASRSCVSYIETLKR